MTPEKIMEHVEFFGSAKASYAIAHAANDPDAAIDFAEEALDSLLKVKAEVERQAAALEQARAELEGWNRIGESIAHHIPEHYEAAYNSHEDWARDAADVVAKAQAWRKNARITPGDCDCLDLARQRATKPEEHARFCPAYVSREETELDAAMEKIYPSEDYL